MRGFTTDCRSFAAAPIPTASTKNPTNQNMAGSGVPTGVMKTPGSDASVYVQPGGRTKEIGSLKLAVLSP
jgi:hypothetical protein